MEEVNFPFNWGLSLLSKKSVIVECLNKLHESRTSCFLFSDHSRGNKGDRDHLYPQWGLLCSPDSQGSCPLAHRDCSASQKRV